MRPHDALRSRNRLSAAGGSGAELRRVGTSWGAWRRDHYRGSGSPPESTTVSHGARLEVNDPAVAFQRVVLGTVHHRGLVTGFREHGVRSASGAPSRRETGRTQPPETSKEN